jgi:hypothetical protein
VNASSETAFYFFEFLKSAIPIAGIALVLFATVRRYRAAPTRPFRWLTVISGLWFLVTLINRFALSAPAQRFFIQAAVDRYAASQRQSLYFAVTFWLWTSEQIMILAFGIALFFALRVSHANTSNPSLQATAGRLENDKGEIRK